MVALFGELGTGKTWLVGASPKGWLADPTAVSSPTFTLIHEYQGRLRLIHADLYRLTAAQLNDTGLSDYLDGHTITAIEWADRWECRSSVGPFRNSLITWPHRDTSRHSDGHWTLQPPGYWLPFGPAFRRTLPLESLSQPVYNCRGQGGYRFDSFDIGGDPTSTRIVVCSCRIKSRKSRCGIFSAFARPRS